MARTPDKIGPNDELLIDATAAEVAKRAVRLPANDKEQFEDLMKEGSDAEDFQDAQLQKYRDRVMEKVVAREKGLKDAKEREALERYEGRVAIADGKFRAVGIDKDFTFKERYGRRWYNRIIRKTIHTNELDTLINDVIKTEAEIREQEEELKILQAAQKTRRQCVKLALSMWNERRKAKRNWVLSSGGWDALKSAFAERKQAKVDFKQKEHDLNERSKTIKSKRAGLDSVMAKIKLLQQSGEEHFQKVFGAEIAAIQAVQRGNPRVLGEDGKPNYDERVAKLRNRVREYGKKNNIVHIEYYLNKALAIKPDIVIDDAQFDRGLTDMGDKLYKSPTTARETAREKIKVEKWWEKVFGEKPRDVGSFVAALRQKNPLSLVKILDNTTDVREEVVLKFFFKGEVDGEKVLPQNRALRLEPAVVADKLASTKGYLEKCDTVDTLKKVFYIFAKKWQQLKSPDFDFAFQYILPEARRAKGDYKDVALDLQEEADTTNARELCREFLKDEPDDHVIDQFYRDIGATFGDKTSEVLADPKYRRVLRFYFFGEIAGTAVEGIHPRSLVEGNPRTLIQMLRHSVEYYQKRPNLDEVMLDKILTIYANDYVKRTSVPFYTCFLLNEHFDEIVRKIDDEKTAAADKEKSKEPAKQYAEFFNYKDVHDKFDATQRREHDEKRIELENGNISTPEKDLIEAFLRMKKSTDAGLFKSTVDELLAKLKTLVTSSKLNISVESQSKTWAYMDLAAEFALSEGDVKTGRAMVVKNPIQIRPICDQIVERRFGWEVHQQWQQASSKAQIEQIFRDTTATSQVADAKAILDIRYPDNDQFQELSFCMQQIAKAPAKTAASGAGASASP